MPKNISNRGTTLNKPRFTYQIHKKKGELHWVMFDPDGARYSWGTSNRTKRELEASLKKTCARLSGGLGKWRPAPIDQPAVS